MNSLDLAKPRKIRVLIVPGTDPVGDWMANLISSEQDMTFVGLIRDLTVAVETTNKLSPDVILVDISSGILQHGDLINRLSAPVSGAAIIVVAMMGEVDMVRQAMLYGAQGFLLKPFSEQELLSSVRQAYDLVVQRRDEVANLPRLLPGAAGKPAPKAKIVAVFSPKGGVGCTTIAINLAIALKMTTQKPVVLVDGDLRFGDIDTALNITSTTSIGTLLPHLDELDNGSLEQALVQHNSGIRVLTAPPHLDAADAIRPDELKQLLGRLAELGDGYVVVDAWSALDDCTLTVLDVCEYLLVVTTPQVTALRDAHRFLEVLNLLRYDTKRTMLIVNHCYQRSNLRLNDVERALGHPIAQTIDYTPHQVTASLNRGVPLLQEYGDSPAARNIVSLAQQIAGQQAVPLQQEVEAKPMPAKAERSVKRGVFFRGPAPGASKVKA